jgi:hypothetical protein
MLNGTEGSVSHPGPGHYGTSGREGIRCRVALWWRCGGNCLHWRIGMDLPFSKLGGPADQYVGALEMGLAL